MSFIVTVLENFELYWCAVVDVLFQLGNFNFFLDVMVIQLSNHLPSTTMADTFIKVSESY